MWSQTRLVLKEIVHEIEGGDCCHMLLLVATLLNLKRITSWVRRAETTQRRLLPGRESFSHLYYLLCLYVGHAVEDFQLDA